VTVSHEVALLEPVQGQPVPDVTVTVPVPAAAPIVALAGEIEAVQVMTAPACVTVNVCPPMVIVPVREADSVLAVTE
jgi:hypothetical protein